MSMDGRMPDLIANGQGEANQGGVNRTLLAENHIVVWPIEETSLWHIRFRDGAEGKIETSVLLEAPDKPAMVEFLYDNTVFGGR